MKPAEQLNVTDLIDNSKIGRFQIGLFSLCAMSLLMDGFVVQAMGYVAPEVIIELGMSDPQLGNVLAAANFGLLIGALFFTMLADKIGRRPVLIIGTFVFSVLTLLTARAETMNALLILRFLGGIGMGSIIPNATALIGEYSPKRKRVVLIMTITVAFTLGAAVAGFVTAWVMPALGWRAVFTLGGSIPLVVGILMIFWLPESLQFSVVHKKFDKIGRWVRSVDPSASIGPGTEYVVGEQASRGVPLKQLFSDGRAIVTLLYWTVNFTNLLNLYFLAGLLPRILSNPEGPNFSTSTSALIGSMMQVGGTIGTFGLAWLIAKKGFTPILTLSFAVASVAIALMGSQTVLGAVPLLTIIVFVAGWAVIGGQPGLNALAATYYPTSMRSTGIGWGLGIGRIGAIVGPYVGGRLLDLPIQQLFLVFAGPAVISTLVMLSLHFVMGPRTRAT